MTNGFGATGAGTWWRNRGLAAVIAVAVSVSACGVPVDRAPREVSDEALPSGLSSTTTTVADPEPTTTEMIDVDVFLIGENGLEAAERTVPVPVTTQAVIEALIAAGDDEELLEERRLRSFIPTSTTVLGAEVDPQGFLTINLGQEGIFELEDEQQLQALAQLVFTATGLASVQGVLLQIEGELRPLPTDGEPTEGLRPVTREDYASLA